MVSLPQLHSRSTLPIASSVCCFGLCDYCLLIHFSFYFFSCLFPTSSLSNQLKFPIPNNFHNFFFFFSFFNVFCCPSSDIGFISGFYVSRFFIYTVLSLVLLQAATKSKYFRLIVKNFSHPKENSFRSFPCKAQQKSKQNKKIKL